MPIMDQGICRTNGSNIFIEGRQRELSMVSAKERGKTFRTTDAITGIDD